MKWQVKTSIPSLTSDVIILDARDCRHLIGVHGVNADVVSHTIGAWVSLLSDSRDDTLKPSRVIKRFYYELLNDFRGQTRFYCELGDALLDSVKLGTGSDIDVTFIPDFRKTPVFREYLAWFTKREASSFRFLLSFCFFAKKAPYDDPDFESTALRKWTQVEMRLKDLVLPCWVNLLKEIITDLLPYDREGLFASHGPGAVADLNVSTYHDDKTVNMRLSPKLSMWLTWLSLKGVFNSWPQSGSDCKTTDKTQNSRLMFVPKNYKTARSICMEPASCMWAQQGVRQWLERSISSGPLRDRVVLPDQRANQIACKIGSATGMIDTIDLSAASDSVSWDLIKEIFPTEIVIDLFATRSGNITLPDGTDFAPAKFAPMGSALCFPVQCVVYAACVILATCSRLIGKPVGDWDSDDVVRFRIMLPKVLQGCKSNPYGDLQQFQVYGDDITCDFTVTSYLMDMLEALGFQVNREKSFTGMSAVRESCGKYYIAGYDVSPMKYSLSPRFDIRGRYLDPYSLQGTVAMCNRARSYGYNNLAEYLFQSMLGQKVVRDTLPNKKPMLRVSASIFRYTDTPQDVVNFLELGGPFLEPDRKTRHSRRYHRKEVRALGLTFSASQKSYDAERVDDYYYTREAAIHLNRKTGGWSPLDETPSPQLRDLRAGARLEWSWIPQ